MPTKKSKSKDYSKLAIVLVVILLAVVIFSISNSNKSTPSKNNNVNISGGVLSLIVKKNIALAKLNFLPVKDNDKNVLDSAKTTSPQSADNTLSSPEGIQTNNPSLQASVTSGDPEGFNITVPPPSR